MKSKKSIVLIVMLLIVSLFSMGCVKKAQEKIGTKIGEKVIEKATGGEVNIDTEDGMSIEMEDGAVKTGENLEWPQERMGSLPKPDATIKSITQIEDSSTSVILSFDKKNGGSDYMQKLIDLGYEQTSLSESEDHLMYMGTKDEDDTAIIFNYQPSEEYGSITLIQDNEKED